MKLSDHIKALAILARTVGRHAVGDQTYSVVSQKAVYRPAAIAGAFVNAGAGNVPAGTYYYNCTFVTAEGTTSEGSLVSNTNIVLAGASQVTVNGIPVSSDARVVARNIYRNKVGGTNRTSYYVGQIANNTATTFTDNVAEASLGALIPYRNTTGAGTLGAIAATDYTAGGGTFKPTLHIDPSTVAVGFDSNRNGTAPNATCVGAETGLSLTTANGAVLIGTYAGSSLTTGNNNIIVGYTAGLALTTGLSNVIVGTAALDASATSQECVAIGYNALGAATSGNGNIAIGSGAGVTLVTGNNNVHIGSSAGNGAPQVTGVSNSIAIGKLAGTPRSNMAIIGDNLVTETQLRGQVRCSTGDATVVAPTASAALEVVSTSKGFLPPKLTTAERDAIASPAEGLVIYNTTTKVLNFHNGTAWGAV